MSAKMTGAEAIQRKLLFGERALDQGQVPDCAVPARTARATGALPGGVSGGEDFSNSETETP